MTRKNLNLIYVIIIVIIVVLFANLHQFSTRYYLYSDKNLYQEFDKLIQKNADIINYKEGYGFPKGIEFDFEVNEYYNEEKIMNDLIEIFQKTNLNRMSKKRAHYRKDQFEIRFSFQINDVDTFRYLTYISELENETIQIWEKKLYADDKTTQVQLKKTDGNWNAYLDYD